MVTENTTYLRLEKNGNTTVITVDDRAATRQSIINQIRDQGHGFVERSDWRAAPYQEGGLGREKLAVDWDYTKIAIHHAGRSFHCGVGAFQLKEIENIHVNSNLKEVAVGYHYALDCSGNVFEGRDLRFKGASVSNNNTGLIGIVFLENLTGSDETLGSHFSHSIDEIPLKQKEAALALIKALTDHFHIAVLGGHREFPNQIAEGKICPGNLGIRVTSELRALFGLAKP